MATKKSTSKKSKSDRMPGFFESGPVQITHRPKGYYEVQRELRNKGKGKK